MKSNELFKLSRKQWLLLAAALVVGAVLGFIVQSLAVAAGSAGAAPHTVSKTVTVTQFSCNATNYDFEIGNFCVVDKIALVNQPKSMDCIAKANFANPGFTLVEKCDPNGSLIGNPFFVAWKSGSLELLMEDGTYNFNPPRMVTYSAVT